MFYTIIGTSKDDFKAFMACWADFDYAFCGSNGAWVITVESKDRDDLIDLIDGVGMDHTTLVYEFRMKSTNVSLPGNLFFAPYVLVKGWMDE